MMTVECAICGEEVDIPVEEEGEGYIIEQMTVLCKECKEDQEKGEEKG